MPVLRRLMRLIEIDLPEYDNYEDLRRQLLTAITQGAEYVDQSYSLFIQELIKTQVLWFCVKGSAIEETFLFSKVRGLVIPFFVSTMGWLVLHGCLLLFVIKYCISRLLYFMLWFAQDNLCCADGSGRIEDLTSAILGTDAGKVQVAFISPPL